jgi:protein-histidine pros-kinase
MKLLLKFNAILLLTLGIGLAAAGYASYRWLAGEARRQVDEQARLLIDAATSVRSYTTDHVKQLVPEGTFVPETVPAFAAKTVFTNLTKQDALLGGYEYREAAKKPTNRDDKASPDEEGMIDHFQKALDEKLPQYPMPTEEDARKELRNIEGTPTDEQVKERLVQLKKRREEQVGKILAVMEDHGEDRVFREKYFFARPLAVTNETCLHCHDTFEQTKKKYPPMEYYGDNGYGWTMDQVIAVQVVRVPMQAVNKIQADAFRSLMGSMVTVVLATFLLLNLGLVVFVTRPVARLSQMAVEISRGNLKMGELPVRGQDEISTLTASFNRMYRSLLKAIKLLKEP